MKNVAQMFVVFVLGLAAPVANAEIVKVPVDPSTFATAGVPGYDPTIVGRDSPPMGWSAQPATASPNGSLSAQSTVSAAATTVGSLVRWPAAGKPERVMQNTTAYYRDAFTGIRYTAYAMQDGDSWTVKAVFPTEDGGSRTQTVTWPDVTYYAQIGGWPSCWYSAGWLYYICGTTSIDITAYKKSQCDPAGNWTLQVYENGAAVGGPQPFTMRLEVPPMNDTPESPLIALNQNTNPIYPYDSMCYRTDDLNARLVCDPDPSQPDPANPTRFLVPSDPNLRAFSIGKKGCALTSAAMVNAYHNAIVPDGGVIGYNDAMKTAGGFSTVPGYVGQVVWGNLPRGMTSWISFGSNEYGELRRMICTHGPQIMSVNGGGHYVMVTGKEGLTASTSWKIYDPAGGVANTTVAARGYTLQRGDGTRLYRGPDAQYEFPIYGIKIALHSPAELIVTAPDGSKTGFDPISDATYNQIPFGNYLAEGYDDVQTGEIEPHKVKFVSISGGPADGEYTVEVVGTATGTYSMDVERIGNDGRSMDRVSNIDIPTQYGERHTYAVQYSATSLQSPSVQGGYDGGGQKPTDVNRFLRYSSPSAARTSLAAGTTLYRLAISYGGTIIAGTLKATLNGADVSLLFSPAAGTSQVVQLSLSRGSNTLVLAIDGQTSSGRVATDTDRLVFNVP